MSESENMVANVNRLGERDTLIDTQEYRQLVDNISLLWDKAKEKAVLAVNSELLDANWLTGRYIVEFEQDGKTRAQYGKQLLVNLSKDLARMCGKGFSRSNLTYMRKLYLTFPKCETLSHKLTWSHYFGICQSVRNCKPNLIPY